MTTVLVPEETKGERFLRVARLADFFVLTNCMVAEIDATDLRTLNYPPWVRRCGRRVTRALFPRVYRSVEGKSPSDAYDLGLAFGLMESGQIKLAEIFKDLGPIPLPVPSDTELEKLWAVFYGDNAKGFTFRTDGDPMPIEMREDIEQRQREFSLEQQADFHQGVADVTRMMAGENESTTTTNQYLFMLIFWKAIERLPSFEVFFEIMTRGFGQNVIGNDPKRLRQVCHRVGKRFRRPGRPPKLPQAS